MLYGKLYGIESYCREQNFSFDQRKEIRQEKSVPIFDELSAWVREKIPKLTTLRSPIGKALAYFSEREKQLGVYLHDGMLLMDTNLIESAILPIALGYATITCLPYHMMLHKTPPLYILCLQPANSMM